MDGESDIDAVFPESFGHFCNSVLGLSNGHTVTGNNDNAFTVDKKFSNLLNVSFNVFSVLNLFLFGSSISPGPEDNVVQGSVHGFAHNVRKDGTG